jgi:hypothetical protein
MTVGRLTRRYRSSTTQQLATAHVLPLSRVEVKCAIAIAKQVRRIFLGRQRVRFMYQASHSFKAVNQSPWIGQLKTSAGYAKVAGIELLLLDLVRYFRQAAGLDNVAQIVHDLGGQADPRKLARVARACENATVPRLG